VPADFWPRAFDAYEGIQLPGWQRIRGQDPAKAPNPEGRVSTLESYWNFHVDLMMVHYSAGSPIEEIAALVEPTIEIAEEWMDAAVLIKGERWLQWTFRQDMTINPASTLVRTLSFTALLAPELSERALALLGRLGGATTLGMLFGTGQGDEVGTPKPYDRLEPLLSLADRSAALAKYLSGWYGAHRKAGWWGADKHVDVSVKHIGYWAVEAAAASVLLAIDDSMLTSEYYPRELADYGRSIR
jgi:hypothetical protein